MLKKYILFALPVAMIAVAVFPWAFGRSAAETSTSTNCGVELVTNGNFETPTVTNADAWDVFPSGTSGMGWSVAWQGGTTTFDGETRPTTALLEFQKNPHAGWSAQSGSQYIELDTDWIGPESLKNGEDASVKISQTLATEAGATYRVVFYTAPRPYEPNNQNVNHPNTRLENIVQMTFGGLQATINSPANSSVQSVAWTKREYTFVATSSQTVLNFTELGAGDSYGMFLDSVSVKKECGTTPPPPVNPNCTAPNGVWDSNSFWQKFTAGQITASISVVNGQAVATVSNNTNCAFPLSFSVYKIYDYSKLSTQVIYGKVPVSNLNGGESRTLSLAMPPCQAQIDLWYGQAVDQLVDDPAGSPSTYGWGRNPSVFKALVVNTGPLCGSVPQLTCSPNSQTVNVGQTAYFTATGGTGNYAWYAYGSNNIYGAGSNFQTSYFDQGTKYVTVTSAGLSTTCTVGVNASNTGSPSLLLEKNVRNATTGTSYSSQTTAKQGDWVEYWVKIRNNGNATATNLYLTDTMQNGYLVGNWGNFTVSKSYSGSLASGQTLFLGDLAAGSEISVQYRAQVLSTPSTPSTVTNTARVTSSNAGYSEDIAYVYVSTTGGETVNLVYAKKAWNDTKNKDAQSVTASREDFITYTLSVTNTGNATQNNFVITDDLSGVLPLADMTDLGGGTLTSQVISYPSVSLAPGQTVSKTFRVRVKYSLAPNISYVMKNTYGNTVNVTIHTPPTYTPPRVGAPVAVASSFGLAVLSTFGLSMFRRRKKA